MAVVKKIRYPWSKQITSSWVLYVTYSIMFYTTWHWPVAGWAPPSGPWCRRARPASGLCLLAGPPRNRWGDSSLGEGSRDTTSGDRSLTTLLRPGRLWDFLVGKPKGTGTKDLIYLLYCIYKHLKKTCLLKTFYWLNRVENREHTYLIIFIIPKICL